MAAKIIIGCRGWHRRRLMLSSGENGGSYQWRYHQLSWQHGEETKAKK
jgi:hypothetical protein